MSILCVCLSLPMRQPRQDQSDDTRADEFIRRFLLHALPDGFHRIRHYGFLANGSRGDSLALCRRLLEARVTSAIREPADNHTPGDRPLTAADFAICPDCGGTYAADRSRATLLQPTAILL